MRTLNWRIQIVLTAVIVSISVFLSFVSGWDIIEKISKEEHPTVLTVTYVLFLSFLFMICHVALSWQLTRKARYANIASHIHRINHSVRDILTYLDEHDPKSDDKREKNERTRIAVGQILDSTVSIFAMLTGTNCRACIKLIYTEMADDAAGVGLYVHTYIRDGNSNAALQRTDVERRKQNSDPLTPERNRVFSDLFDLRNSSWYYVNNDLIKAYKNRSFNSTSFEAYDPRRAVAPPHSWPLPYRSTITCVIRQNASPLMPRRDCNVLGFLAIDSESRGVFNRRWDVQLALSIADALFHPLEKISRAFENEHVTTTRGEKS